MLQRTFTPLVVSLQERRIYVGDYRQKAVCPNRFRDAVTRRKIGELTLRRLENLGERRGESPVHFGEEEQLRRGSGDSPESLRLWVGTRRVWSRGGVPPDPEPFAGLSGFFHGLSVAHGVPPPRQVSAVCGEGHWTEVMSQKHRPDPQAWASSDNTTSALVLSTGEVEGDRTSVGRHGDRHWCLE